MSRVFYYEILNENLEPWVLPLRRGTSPLPIRM
jgi:hypothetical protein